MTVIQVKLRKDESGYPPFFSEDLRADEIGELTYRICSTPVFANGIAVGDTVTVKHYGSNPVPFVEEVVEFGGHSTIRVVYFDDIRVDENLPRLSAIGCRREETDVEGVAPFDVPPGASLVDAKVVLDEGYAAGWWDYSIGVVSAAHHTAELRLTRPRLDR
jgi:hypothetical protein